MAEHCPEGVAWDLEMMTGKEDFDRTRADYPELTAKQKTPPPLNFQGT